MRTFALPLTGLSRRAELGDRGVEQAAGDTLQAPADRLNVEGMTTPTGRSWSTAFVTSLTLRLVGGVRDPWRRRTVP
jgi:hypothetical protein